MPQSHVRSYLTGAIFADGSTVVLKGETVFANNTADDGGTTDCGMDFVFQHEKKRLP